MPLDLAHVRMRLLSLLRTPVYVAGTLTMTSVIPIFIGIGLADTNTAANAIMASFKVFAVTGGPGAQERLDRERHRRFRPLDALVRRVEERQRRRLGQRVGLPQRLAPPVEAHKAEGVRRAARVSMTETGMPARRWSVTISR